MKINRLEDMESGEASLPFASGSAPIKSASEGALKNKPKGKDKAKKKKKPMVKLHG